MRFAKEVQYRAAGRVDMDLPVLGFGGASVGNLYRSSTDEEAFAAMAAALDAGIAYFDTAPFYGHGLSETRIGAFMARTGKRPAILSTKAGRLLEAVDGGAVPDLGFVDPLPFRPVFDYSYDGVMRSFEESCRRLRTEHVDMLLMHDIGAMTHGEEAHRRLFGEAMTGGARAMAELKKSGQVTAIGLGVNEWQVCAESFGHAEFDIFMLAGRYTLLEQEPLGTLFPECEKRGVKIIAAAPFNSGLLARRPDRDSHYNYAKAPEAMIARATRIFDICESHGASAQAVALQFPLRHPAVLSVVNGMSSAQRVEQTRKWYDEDIPAAVWEALRAEGVLAPAAPAGDAA